MQELTKVDLIISGALAPSTKLTATEVTDVLRFLFGFVKDDVTGIVCDMVKAKVPIEEVIASYEDEKSNATLDSTANSYELYKTIVEKHEAVTLHITTKETSGILSLGIFMLCVQEEMQKLQPTVRCKVDYAPSVHPERKHAADSALLYSSVNTEMTPCFVVEYKPRVANDLRDQEPFHLTEVFLQAFYLRRKGHKHPILHCLTDLKDFHYFLITDTKHPAKLVLETYWYVEWMLWFE